MSISHKNIMLKIITMKKSHKKIFFIASLVISLLIILCSMNFYEFIMNEQIYSCSLTQNLDYNVKIFPNSVFDKTILPSNDVYISKLVDNINVQYSYHHSSDIYGEMELYYTVNATTLIIERSDKDSADVSKVSPIKKKEHVLKDREKTNSSDNKTAGIEDEIVIDYDTYMKEIDEFKKDIYSLSYSALLLDFKVEAIKHIDGESNVSVVSTGSVKIPLDEESFIITTSFTANENKKYMRYDNPQFYVNYTLLAMGCSLLVLVFVLFYLNKRLYYKYFLSSSESRKIEKFLFEYNDVIFISKDKPDFANKTKIFSTGISGIMNLYALTKQPIIYYKEPSGENMITHYFFINHYDVVCVFTFETSP